MDGALGQYVTVRRDFFAATSLVASAATLPVTLAPPNTSPSLTTANEVGTFKIYLNRWPQKVKEFTDLRGPAEHRTVYVFKDGLDLSSM